MKHPLQSSTPAISWFRQDLIGSQLVATVQLHRDVKTELYHILPELIVKQCDVMRADALQLILGVPTSASASKLRQLTPRIIEHMATKGWKLEKVTVKVQVKTNPRTQANSPSTKTAAISDQGLNAFSELAHNLHHTELKAAVQHLLQRRLKK